MSLADKIDQALTIHFEEGDFSDIEKNADYHARIVRTIVLGIINEQEKECL